MRIRSRFLGIMTFLLIIRIITVLVQCIHKLSPRKVQIRFMHSPYSDYLYYLFYRKDRGFNFDKVINLDCIPTINYLIVLPEDVASLEIKKYDEIYPLLEEYRNPSSFIFPEPRILCHSISLPPYDLLLSIIKEGEKHFPKFYKFWKEKIESPEKKLIGIWKKQLLESSPLQKLQNITRLQFPSTSLDVGCIYLHLAGSANYNPTAVYTMIFNQEATRPSLSWVLGHEATHLMISEEIGVDWTKHDLAPRAIKMVEKLRGKGHDIEEMLCMFMQYKLSQECGYYDKDRRPSIRYPVVLGEKILESMVNEWKNYINNLEKFPTINDFMLLCVILKISVKEIR